MSEFHTGRIGQPDPKYKFNFYSIVRMDSSIKRSMVFIDAANLNGAWQTYCKRFNQMPKISYSALLETITAGTDFFRGYLYDATPVPTPAKRQSFFDRLRNFGITVVTKELRYKSVTCKHCGVTDSDIPYQKGVDVAIVTDIMSLAFEDAYDVAVVVSGDNDFVDAINCVKRKGKIVWLASFRNSLGTEAMRAADRVIILDDLFSSIAFEERKI